MTTTEAGKQLASFLAKYDAEIANLAEQILDEMRKLYPSALELMQDLRAMGESNAIINRRHFLKRDTMMAAAAIYKGNSSWTF